MALQEIFFATLSHQMVCKFTLDISGPSVFCHSTLYECLEEENVTPAVDGIVMSAKLKL